MKNFNIHQNKHFLKKDEKTSHTGCFPYLLIYVCIVSKKVI